MDIGIGWPGGDIASTLRIAGFIVGGYGALIWAVTVIWVYRDIRARTRDIISQLTALAGGDALRAPRRLGLPAVPAPSGRRLHGLRALPDAAARALRGVRPPPLVPVAPLPLLRDGTAATAGAGARCHTRTRRGAGALLAPGSSRGGRAPAFGS